MPRARVGGALILTGAAAGSAVLLVRPPVEGAYPTCPWRALTGLDCPFCGGLRATSALVHGDWAAAVDHNVLVAAAVPAAVVAGLLLVLLGGRGQGLMDALASDRALRLALAFLLAFFALRLLPFAGWLTT